MPVTFFLVRAVVTEPLREKFDAWYSAGHLPRGGASSDGRRPRPRLRMAALRVLAAAFAALVTLPVAAFEGENLLVTAPAGYKAGFSDRNAKMVMTEFVPAGQSVQNWTEMVTVQVFLGMKRASPVAFRGRMEKLWAASCAKAAMVPISAATENGYEVVLWRLSCPRNKETGKPEMTWFKAIAGNDSFYVVQKAFKFEPPSEQVAEWVAYLNKVSVCDTRLPERNCPSGMR